MDSLFTPGGPSVQISHRRPFCKNYKCIASHCNAMKKDCVISKIEASQDGSPYVYVTLSDPSDYKPCAEKPQNPFGPNMMAFTSPEDMMKNLPKAMGNLTRAMGGGGPLTDSPTFKISMREYEDMAVKVGDKITLEIKKSDSSSGR
jgi:hypothetical protein